VNGEYPDLLKKLIPPEKYHKLHRTLSGLHAFLKSPNKRRSSKAGIVAYPTWQS
jgi:hypothetical protein